MILNSPRTSSQLRAALNSDLHGQQHGEQELTGYTVLLWIEEAVALRGYEPPEMLVHSANPPGHERLLRGIDSIVRRAAER